MQEETFKEILLEHVRRKENHRRIALAEKERRDQRPEPGRLGEGAAMIETYIAALLALATLEGLKALIRWCLEIQRQLDRDPTGY